MRMKSGGEELVECRIVVDWKDGLSSTRQTKAPARVVTARARPGAE